MMIVRVGLPLLTKIEFTCIIGQIDHYIWAIIGQSGHDFNIKIQST